MIFLRYHRTGEVKVLSSEGLSGGYSVNLAHLRELSEKLQLLTAQAVSLCENVDEQAAVLKENWSGEAYEGYELAHRRWIRDAKIMRDDSYELKSHVVQAHNNYAEALCHDRGMWG